ncbi:S41 family peptidase [Agrobacterium tumefaciens]|nr:S41 family peptidase [Agrobacterium tumefaciens]NTE25030.1 S41 family peptidase [Agrobacterium tumefaciens]
MKQNKVWMNTLVNCAYNCLFSFDMKRFGLFLLIIMSYGSVAVAQNPVLTKRIKKETIASISKSLKDNYIFLDTARRMGDFITMQFKIGAYDTIHSQNAFAYKLTTELQSVYHDGHLSISYDPPAAKVEEEADTVAQKAQRLQFRKQVNFGMEKAEIMPGNIGYLKLKGFFPPDQETKATITAALQFVSNSNALVIDVRDNMGGDPAAVSFFSGFFFNKKTHLNDLYCRKEGSFTEFWTTPDTTLVTLKTMPIYILTNKRTFSAGEEFAYNLQAQQRALIVGERTGGGAHPVAPEPVGNSFIANIPNSRAINPITKTNWEGIGVKPDKEVIAEKAIDTVLELIKEK